MKLGMLLKNAGIEVSEDISRIADTEIKNITNNSGSVTEGSLFISVNGRKCVEYGKYIEEARQKGAVAVITQEKRETEADIIQIVREDVLRVYSRLSAAYYGFPANSLKLIGVTGTNGKTSTSYFTKQLLEAVGHKTGLIGTIETLAGKEVISTGLTTPEPFVLHGIFARMRDAGIEYVVMECSSQALDQQRLYGLDYISMGFTNLTQDHLDYHGTFKAYMDAKAIAFTQSETAVLNVDDRSSAAYAQIMGDKPVLTYSAEDENADLFASDIEYLPHSARFTLKYRGESREVTVSTPGRFAVYNAMCAIGLAVSAKVSFGRACEYMPKAAPVKGRAEICYSDENITVIIDYAHTPDAIMNILKAVDVKDGRKVVLFGCGGDRDATKRPLMALVASRYADFMIITSDNPRTEDPQHIIDDILLGMHNVDVPYVTFTDRKEAITYALKNAQKGDTIFLLGKGHEDYQVIGTQKVHMDEREIVRDIMNGVDCK